MRHLSLVTADAFWTEMEKISAPRALKEIRKLIQAGDTAGAAAMAKRFTEKGALKVTGPGSQLKHLGSGIEAQATLVAGAKDAPGQIAVRKAYDPGGSAFSKSFLADKVNAGRKLSRGRNADPRFAQLYSKQLGKGQSGGRYTMHEYVRGQKPSAAQMGAYQAKFEQMSQHGLKGHTLMDFQKNRGNVLMTANGPKVIDYNPYRDKNIQNFQESPPPARQWPGRLQNQAYVRDAADEARQLVGTGTSPSDFRLHPESGQIVGQRLINPQRALRGLGPGSRR